MKRPDRLVIKRKQHPKLFLWRPARKTVNRGRGTKDTIPFIDNLMKDADLESVSEDSAREGNLVS